MTRELNVVIEIDSEGYHAATVPEHRGCHTQAKSLDTLKRVREAIELCLEIRGEPEKSTRFIGMQRIWYKH
ncbi:MAG: type II toxin-antitoxin system HicB family antitoxin [Deltaproteobacteria bacterium]|nr:type II toxin-antitoxin system HicB family antitoxin [Deltaproteobacteria bacterium]